MTTIPMWWLVLSGLFFFVNLVLFVVLAWAAIKLIGILGQLTPKIVAIEGQVQDLIKKVQALTASIQETVTNVGGKTKAVVGSAEGVVQSASRQFERFSPFVIGSLTAIRPVSALSQARQGRSLAKATSRKGIFQKREPKTLIGKVIRFVRR